MCIVGGLLAVCIMTFMANLSQELYVICALIVAYLACLVMAISCIAISESIIKKYEFKSIR